MREHVQVEVASEILSMMMAFAIEDKDDEKLQRLIDEKEKLFLGDYSIIDKAYGEYSDEIKKRLENK